ncbi:MAG: hypothetical protein OK439_05085 [Thaumarchaeota archaeon]|nr:hypothetical protein [Nitrososphaerota archaeon]
MILDERRKASLGRATGVLSIVMGADLFAILLSSKNSLQSLETLVNNVVPINAFILLDVLGGAAAIFAGFSLLRFKRLNTLSFSIGCAFAIFFGVTLALMRASELSNTFFVGIDALIFGAIILSVTVMFLSIYPGRSRQIN